MIVDFKHRKGASVCCPVYIKRKKRQHHIFSKFDYLQWKAYQPWQLDTEEKAHEAYLYAGRLLAGKEITLTSYKKENPVLSFSKWVSLINFRDNGIYIKTPIYLFQKYFHYYFSPENYLIFDTDDLFYYSTRTISRRGGHLFVADYGMQVNILSRYGIKNYAVAGRDYLFANGNTRDFRYENLVIINRYHGVCQKTKQGQIYYETKIHWNGDFLVGRYENEIEAAIAYNKAASTLLRKGYLKDYPVNYIEELSDSEYRSRYQVVDISDKIKVLKSLL